MNKVRIGNDVRIQFNLYGLQDFDQTNVKELRCYAVKVEENDKAEEKATCEVLKRWPHEPHCHGFEPTPYSINACGPSPCYFVRPIHPLCCELPHHHHHFEPGVRAYRMPARFIKVNGTIKNHAECYFKAQDQICTGLFKLVVVAVVYEEGWNKDNMHTYTIDYGNVFELVDDESCNNKDITVNVRINNDYHISYNLTNVDDDTTNLPDFIHVGSTATIQLNPTDSEKYAFPKAEDVIVENATIDSYDETTGTLIISNPTDAVTVTAVANEDTGVFSVTVIGNNIEDVTAPYAYRGQDYNVTVIPNDGCTVNSVIATIGNKKITSSYITNADKSITINIQADQITGNINIVVSAAAVRYNITYNVTGMTVSGQSSIAPDDEITVQFTANKNYTFNDDFKIVNAEYELISNLNNVATFRIYNATGNVTITFTAINNYYTYNYVFSGDGVANKSSLVNGSVQKNTAFTSSIEFKSGYTHTVNITMGGVNITSDVYDEETNVINILSVTGNIVINISTVKDAVKAYLVYIEKGSVITKQYILDNSISSVNLPYTGTVTAPFGAATQAYEFYVVTSKASVTVTNTQYSQNVDIISTTPLEDDSTLNAHKCKGYYLSNKSMPIKVE